MMNVNSIFPVLFVITFTLSAANGVVDACPCDADVNIDGIVNLIDGVCITDCKNGDCSCCLVSCDVNCDGVVDNKDIGDDPINDDSAWLCLFQGNTAETCCPGPTGACCDLSLGQCADDLLQTDCAGTNLVWSEGLACSVVSCPAPPTGACCDRGNGQCTDDVFAVDCDEVALEWTQATACSQVECSVPPPPDGCPCDADVNIDGIVNLIDGVCITDCKNGDCSCCLVSCDVNCDGVVDNKDIGDDPINDDSAWLCLFQGNTAETCCPGPTGACCDLSLGQCADDLLQTDCAGTNLVWSEGLSCSVVSCPAPPTGACCDLSLGQCADDLLQTDCAGTNLVWSEGLACSVVSCPAPPTGACCNRGNGQCTDEVFQVHCDGPDLEWMQAAGCGQVECSVPPPPGGCTCGADVNIDGIVNLIDGVCIADCKNGDCSCCLVSCDVNCDGVVDEADIGDDPLNDVSTWLCFFRGGNADQCCSSAFQDRIRTAPVPALSPWGMAILLAAVLASAAIVLRKHPMHTR